MPQKKAPAKAAPKKVVKKAELVEVEVTAEHLAANPEWVEEGIVVGDVIEVPENDFNDPEAPEEDEEETTPAVTEETTPAVTEETTEKEVVVSKRGTKTDKKATVLKAKANEKEAEKLENSLGGSGEYEIITNLKRNGKQYAIGEKETFEDCLAVRRLVESGCIKKI